MNRAMTNTLTRSSDDYFNIIQCYRVNKLQDHGELPAVNGASYLTIKN